VCGYQCFEKHIASISTLMTEAVGYTETYHLADNLVIVNVLSSSSTLKTEAVASSEKSITTYHKALCRREPTVCLLP
jgi:hypothetical protein